MSLVLCYLLKFVTYAVQIASEFFFQFWISARLCSNAFQVRYEFLQLHTEHFLENLVVKES